MESIEHDKVAKLCTEFLDGSWREVSAEDIKCSQLFFGYGNQTYRCSIKHCKNLPKFNQTEHKEVIVRLYGSKFFKEKDMIKFNSETGEAITLHILSTYGLAPKLLGVFSGGIIVEYIESVVSTVSDWKDVNLCAAMARKMAKFHSISAPLSKDPNFLDLVAQKSLPAKLSDVEMEKYSPEKQKEIEIIFNFPLEDEYKWLKQILPKLGSKVVLSHNDVNPHNILLRNHFDSIDDRIVLVDFEISTYFYRAFDIAQFLKLKNLRVEGANQSDSSKLVAYFEESDNSEIDVIIKEYLKESKALNPDTFDEKYDNFDQLLMEIEFFHLVYCIFLCGLYRPLIVETKTEFTFQFPVQLATSYSNAKEKVLRKYGDPMEWK